MISDALLHEAQGLIYRQWTIACDDIKAIKSEKNDGSEDWTLFHEHKLKEAIARQAKYKGLLDEINPLAPLTRRT